MRSSDRSGAGVRVGGSLLIALVAAIWLAERLFEFKLLPF